MGQNFIADQIRLPPDPKRVKFQFIVYNNQFYIVPARTGQAAIERLLATEESRKKATAIAEVEFLIPVDLQNAGKIDVSSYSYIRDKYR